MTREERERLGKPRDDIIDMIRGLRRYPYDANPIIICAYYGLGKTLFFHKYCFDIKK